MAVSLWAADGHFGIPATASWALTARRRHGILAGIKQRLVLCVADTRTFWTNPIWEMPRPSSLIKKEARPSALVAIGASLSSHAVDFTTF
jgi:hypothetical protein